jgi:DedD protein
MASTASPEASEIRRRGRQRLIGAIALVLLLVVFVPMILDSEPRPARQQPAFAIPPKENAPALPAPAPAKPAPAPATQDAAKPKVAAEAVKPATPPEAKPTAPKAEAKAAAPKLEGFAVQVGAFRDEAKLKQAREKLVAAGVVHYTERLEVSSGPLTRLRAGPFPTREAAEGALATIKRASLEGKIVSLP